MIKIINVYKDSRVMEMTTSSNLGLGVKTDNDVDLLRFTFDDFIVGTATLLTTLTDSNGELVAFPLTINQEENSYDLEVTQYVASELNYTIQIEIVNDDMVWHSKQADITLDECLEIGEGDMPTTIENWLQNANLVMSGYEEQINQWGEEIDQAVTGAENVNIEVEEGQDLYNVTITDRDGNEYQAVIYQGANAVISGATASVDQTIGTPNVVVTMGGTESDRTFDFAFHNLKGEKGEKGDKGDAGATGATGASNELTIGTVSSGASASATITGTSPNQVLNLVLPKGDKGDTGEQGIPGQPSGAPLVASSVSGMTDTTKVYVNTTDGHWYWYDGDSWEDGGVYQAIQIVDKSIKPIKTSFVDELSEFENVFSWDNIEDGGYYDQSGNYVSSSSYSTTPLIEIDYKKGYNVALKTGHITWWNSQGDFVGTSNDYKVKNLPSNVRYLRMAVPKEPTSSQITGVKIYAGKFDALTIKDFEYTMPTLDEEYIISNILKEVKLHTDFFVTQEGTITKAVQSYGTYGCYIVSLENISQITHISNVSAFSVILDENYNAVRTIPPNQTGPFVIANNEKCIAVNVPLIDNVPSTNTVLSVEIKRSFIKNLTIDAEKVFYENNSLVEILKSNKILSGKKWDALGDSITEGPNYLSYISYVKDIGDSNNMNYINKGVSGAWLSQRNNDSIVKKIESVRSDADIITVFAGTNDHSNGVSLGTFASTELTTFYGALKYTCEYLLTNYPNAVKMFVTPLKKGANNNPVISGQSLEQFVNAIKEVCDYYGIPVVDLFHDCQIVPSIEVIKNTYIPDQLHPNTLAHSKLISPLIEDKMKSL